MQRSIVTALLLSLAGVIPAFAQPNPYYRPQTVAAPQQQYAQPRYAQPPAQPQYAEPERSNLGGGFIEFVFSGGQKPYGRPPPQTPPHAPAPQPSVPGQPGEGPPRPL